jgi:hypothetical protein
MVNLRDKVEAELENIDLLINELPPHDQLPRLSILELAGVSTLIHNFYNGIENVLKQILKDRNISLPAGASWHKDLLNISVEKQIVSPSTRNVLGEYLAFRHFFIHAYALDLYPDKMEPLVEQCKNVYLIFKDEINIFLYQYYDNKKN